MFFDQKRILKVKECQAISFLPLNVYPKWKLKKINRFTAILSGPFDRGENESRIWSNTR